MRLRSQIQQIAACCLLVLFLAEVNGHARPAELLVYEVHQNLSLGGLQGNSPKEYYVNFGAERGLRDGDILQVSRRMSTYDSANQQFFRDVVFPIARIKVIHADLGASVCRLEKFLPDDSTVIISPRVIMVGDLVQPVQAASSAGNQ